jgi:hypothetical protein
VLWEYGGIYADLYTATGMDFWTKETEPMINDEGDRFFVVEDGETGFLRQYFMAVSLSHLEINCPFTNHFNVYKGPGALENQ